MPTACPHCHEPIESSELSPASCEHCGSILPRAVAASDITIDYVPGRAEPGSPKVGAAPTAVSHDQVQRVGDYRLVRSLGEGGMGIVWEAEQAGTGRRVALKLISPRLQPSRETVERFLREGQLAASVSHPRSTFVFGAGEQNGQPYIAMELMPGQTLKDLLDRDGPLPVERAVDHILDVIDGLEAAHAQGVVHRDVKPSNCFLDTEGRVKVGDFGLSKSLISDSELTRSGAFLGTPQFAAPEQVRGSAAMPATDIYAVGATLFCLLSGHGPFEGDAPAVIAQIISDLPPRLRTLRPDAPRTLERIIARTLAKEPARRFSDLTQLRQALAPFATRGSSIAEVGRRLAAYMLDQIFISLVMMAAIVAILTAGIALANYLLRGMLATDPRRVAHLLQIVEAGLSVAYFTFTEARWGGGLGKRLLGLRVIGPNGEPPDFARSLLRAVFVPGALGLPLLTPVFSLLHVSDPKVAVADADVTGWLAGIAPTAFILLCMVTMRTRNGYRGLHEFISGTRVVTPHRRATARQRRVPVVAPIVASVSPMFGPFRASGMLGMSGCSVVWQSQDSLLARPVWVYESSVGPGGFSPARRAVARPGRQHWLQGGGSADRHWDAFEAAAGAPLVDVLRRGARWGQVRLWLLELVEELAAALEDKTLPPSLSLDQVWITRGGTVKLLDAPISVAANEAPRAGSPFAPMMAERSPAGPPFAPMSPEAQAVGLLRGALTRCTRGQLLPSHVTELADELSTRPATRDTLTWSVARLRDVTRQPTELGWDDRLGVFAVTLGTELPFYFAVAFSAVWFVVETLHWQQGAVAALALFAWLLPALVGFAFRGGPAFWLTRIDVLRRDGRRAGRWRCAWRSLVAWTTLTLPYAMMAAVYPVLETAEALTGGPAPVDASNLLAPTFWIFMTGVCSAFYLGCNLCLGVVYALLRPQRGIQDLLAGTFLMPR